jgi:predicted lipoprotein
MILDRVLRHAAGIACILVAMVSPEPSVAAPDAAATAQRVVAQFVVPRYQELRSVAAMQDAKWRDVCATPSLEGIATLRRAYLAAADAWSAIEFLAYGPAASDFRLERLSFWPDRQNATSKGLAGLLKGHGEEGLQPKDVAGSSAAAQGLPALERLLYDVEPGAYLAGTPEARRRCAVGKAIADNVAAMTGDIASEWDREAGQAAAPGKATEFLTRVVTDLLANLERVGDLKIKRVVGSTTDSVRPQVAEGWRSGRSLRAIAVNLETAETVVRLLLERTSESSATATAIGKARALADRIDGDVWAKAADPTTRLDVLNLLDAVSAARRQAMDEVPTALGIAVGFNSSDGD